MKVLLATDGSEAAATALALVGSIEWPAGSVLRVISAVDYSSAAFSGAWAPGLAQEMERQRDDLVKEAGSTVQAAARELDRPGLSVETQVSQGRPGSCIVDDATRFGADLIVLGSRGHGPIGSMLLGSVSAEVADHATCPVLVARGPRLTRVLLAADGSEFSHAAELWVARWPIFKEAAIEVTSVAPVGPAWTRSLALSAYAPSTVEFEEIDRLQLADYKRVADEAATRLQAAGLRATPRLAQGDPAHEIIQAAKEDSADVIVLGTHGRTGLKRLMMGSVARNVMLNAHCSVLVVRPAHQVTAA